MHKKIGITGGIGSGKTTVCKLFEALGIPVYYADERAKKIMVTDEFVISSLKENFGKKTFTSEGKLDSAYLAKIVFNDSKQLSKLNTIVHPAVFKDIKKWHDELPEVPYAIEESAIMVENGSYRRVDALIMVTASKELRIQRVVARDGVTRESVRARMDKQMPDTRKCTFADFIVENNQENSLAQQVWSIHQILSNWV